MKMKEIQERYEKVSALIVDPKVMKGNPDYPRLLKEHGALDRLMRLYQRYMQVKKELEDAKNLLADTDPEMRQLAKDDIARLEPEYAALRRQLILKLSVSNEDLSRNVIMEIRPGTGGEEAALFTGDLYKMYSRYASSKHWKFETISLTPSEMGGYKEVVVSVSGDEVYPRLRFEGGTHRVQRVPETESQGRIHTSTATVAILPEAEEVDIELRPEDLEITAMHSRGPGGQSVNTACSAVRVVHKPTGLAVHCEVERSQHQNKLTALKLLRSRLMELEKNRRVEEQNSTRRSQTGTGERSEKIRTYNFPQARVTDHRLEGDEKNYNVDRVIEGDLDPIVEKLSEQEAFGLLEEDDGKSA